MRVPTRVLTTEPQIVHDLPEVVWVFGLKLAHHVVETDRARVNLRPHFVKFLLKLVFFLSGLGYRLVAVNKVFLALCDAQLAVSDVSLLLLEEPLKFFKVLHVL